MSFFLEREEKATLAQRRSCCSLLGLISDDPVTQALLPLVLLVNDKTVTAAETLALEASLPCTTNCWLLRRKSAWVDADVMVWFFGIIRQCLCELEPIAQFVLLMDCSPVHATQRVVRAAALNKIHLVFIAAHMTSVLQPLDVYAFSILKKRLGDAYEDLGHASADGGVSTLSVLCEFCKISEDLLFNKSWLHAFRGCGFGDQQKSLGKRARRHLGHSCESFTETSELPTLQQLHDAWFGRRLIPLGWLFHLCTISKPEAEAEVKIQGSICEGSVVDNSPWHGRLRSSSSLFLEVPASPPGTLPICPTMVTEMQAQVPLMQEPIAQQRVPELPQGSSSSSHQPQLQRLPVGRPLFHRRHSQ